MRISEIFDVFSRRHLAVEDQPCPQVPPSLRTKLVMYCDEVFRNDRVGSMPGDYREDFWSEVHRALRYRHGKSVLSPGPPPRSASEDVVRFLERCSAEEFFDFLEDLFRADCFFNVAPSDDNEIVGNFNTLIASESTAFRLTKFVKETREGSFLGRPGEVIATLQHPRVILRENEAVHTSAIDPALVLLADPRFKAANSEFLEALTDYRKGDYPDCLTKCGSAFESTLKIICTRRNWPYSQHDTASRLVKTVIEKSDLPSYTEQPLMLIATLRNRLSRSHGAGDEEREPPRYLARYAVNATAGAILLLTDATVDGA